MIGKTISHYKIIEEIGSGGMGVVYKAEDTKLKRTVALKFLPPELTRDPKAKERFIREAQAASGLQHHNICTIHDIDETPNGQLFIVMDCYEGQTLKDILVGAHHDAPNHPIPKHQVISIAIQIAEGIAKAHEKGIVHRDIKPANILVTNDGIVKILDFGLAKLAGQAQLTKDSSTLGTVAYMSPEQLSGKEIDQRTDIWSLGVLLYEMLTDELPFKGEYEQAIVYAILNEESKSLENIPVELQDVVQKVLRKNPEERYSKARELSNDLISIRENYISNKHVQPTQKSARKRVIIISAIAVLILIATFVGVIFYPTSELEISIKTLAVLPLINIKEDPKNDFLGFALADEIITDLSYLQNLSVRPASSVRKYHLKDIDILNAGEELNADYILTGNYQIELDEIRLHVELIRITKIKTIWQDEIKEKYDNAFRIQDLVSEKVIDGLKINFSSDERNRMVTDIPKNLNAYDYYQLSLVKPTTTNGNLAAIDLLEKSIIHDSTFAPTYNQLGFRIHSLTSYNLRGIRKLEEAEVALNKALILNPELLSALGNLARIYTETGRLMEAQKLVNQMFNINQNNAFAHFVQGYIYRYAGLLSKAKKEMEKAVSIDPTDRTFRSLGITHFYLGEYENALKAFDIDKGSWYSLTYQGITLFHMGKSTIAREYFTAVVDMDPESYSADLSSAYRAYIDKNMTEAIQKLNSMEQCNPSDADMWFLLSSAYAIFGDKEGTIRTGKKAVNIGLYIFPYLKKHDYFNFVSNESEFQEILDDAKEKHENYRKILLSN